MAKNLATEKLDKGGMIDAFRKKLVSRKLMVWLTATGLMCFSNLQSGDWVAISLAYIGIQGIADIASTWRHGK